jgi:CO/xanthine dehydrogenase FAD-binding subunit
MDITTITEVVRRPADQPGADWRAGDAWLAGGTWLYSVPQPDLRRLVDLTTLEWDPLVALEDGLEIGATCTIRDLYAFEAPAGWTIQPLIRFACESFLASFKIWNSATVGGNICMSLPAGPMITLTVALDATYVVLTPDGSERTVAAADFVTGNNENVLVPGEILRRIDIPASSLRIHHTHRRFTLTHMGRSSVFLIGTRSETGALRLTITAGTTHPVVLTFDSIPSAADLREQLDAVPADVWFDDPNGTPAHREHLTRHFAEEIRTELEQTEGLGA